MSLVGNKQRVNIIIDTELKATIQRIAKEDGRSFSNMVVTILKEYAEKREPKNIPDSQ